jgi:glycosyltransferase involved in cell wall biosynthesis
MTTALASDGVAFNSKYNLTTFIEGLEGLRRHATDMSLDTNIRSIRARAKVLPLGLDFDTIDAAREHRSDGPPVVVWNHRWEHDKNPEMFFETLFKLDDEGIDFRLIVLGQSFERRPDIFEKAKRKLKHRTIHFGYADSKQEYAGWLRRGDIVVSTAHHEFFGISVLEAARAGCRPLLPKRLSYPEMFPDEFLYDNDDLAPKLKDLILKGKRLSEEDSVKLTDAFSWSTLSPKYEMWIRNARIWENIDDII